MNRELANLQQRLSNWLGALGVPETHAPDGVSVVDVDDIPVLISVFHDGGACWIRLVALAATDVSPSVELLHELLTSNVSAVVGSWRLFDDGTLAFAATLPGSGLDHDGFAATLRRVAWHACAPPLPPPCGGQCFGIHRVDPAS